jgi:hypothetical protein
MIQEIRSGLKGAGASDEAMSWMASDSSPGGGKTFISSPKVNISCGPRSLLFDLYCGSFRGREKAGS